MKGSVKKKVPLFARWFTMGRIAIAMILHDKVKSAGTLIGVVFAVLLSNQQAGIFLGLITKNIMFVENAQADIWIAPRGAETLQAGPSISIDLLYRARVTPGIRLAQPLIYTAASVALPNGGTHAVTLVGSQGPERIGGPWNIVAGSAEVINRQDTMIFEDSERTKLGGINIGSVREVSGHRVVVGGFTWGLEPFGPTFAFADYDTARLLTRMDSRHTHFVLCKVERGQDPERLAAEMQRQMPDARVLTRPQFRNAIVNFLLKGSIGLTFGTSTMFGLLIGFVIVSLSMFSAVIDNIREFGTLKAIGATVTDLARVMFVQAVVFSTIGTLLGLTAVTRIGEAMRSPKLALVLPWQLIVGTTVVMQLLCIFASIGALWRIRKIEPGMVFR